MTAESIPKKQGNSKLWLWTIPIFGICVLSLCLAGSGLILWPEDRTNQAEKSGPVVSNAPPQQDGREVTPSHSPTPVSIPTPASPTSTSNTSPPALSAQADHLTLNSCGHRPSFDTLAATMPALSPISFATRHSHDGWPLDTALQFTTAVTKVQASFGYDGMRKGLTWERVWYFGDKELLRGSGVWDAGLRGQLTVHAEAGEGGFAPGRYRLEIYVAGELLSQGSFLLVAENTPARRPIQIAYTTWNGHKHQINLLDLNSNEVHPLVEFARTPALSSDGTSLIFYGESGIEGGTAGLWTLDLTQKTPAQLNEETFFQSITWSPHRRHVASAMTTEKGSHLVLWDLTQDKAYPGPPGEDPAWSPEGRRLVYRGCTANNWNISTINVISNVFDLDSVRQLTEGNDSQPNWSWDGQQIAFVRQEGGNQDIYTIAFDGTNLRRLTNHPATDTSPAWTPDHRLLFRSLRNGQWGLYVMNADGSNQRRLISTSSLPNWQPDRLAVSTDVLLIEPTPTPPPKPKVQIPPGHGLLLISNQQNNDEMTFTIDNQEHKIPPFQVKTLPLEPGHYTWTGSWPGKHSRTGIADIMEGQVAYPIVER